MQTVLNFVVSWPEHVSRAFTEHALAAAVVTIAAIGIFVVLQRELRPYHLWTNIGFVAVGWLASVSVLALVMAGLRKAWAAFESALPFVAKLSGYLYGICERHPILALVIVGVGTTAYFLKQPWPMLVSWGPVRAACAVFGIALAIHVAGPIADLVAAEPAAAASPAGQAEEKFVQVPPQEAVARAIKAGDTRYVSVRQCVDEVSGYPVAQPGQPEITSPWTIGVRRLGASCYESLGHAGEVRMRKHQEYAAEYNRLMYEHNKRPAREHLTAR
jgi:hypothetical protein